MPPLFSVELRKIRGTTSIVAMSRECKISREAVRLIENGSMAPSNDVLFRWLATIEETPENRPDIVQSILSKRADLNRVVRETEELRRLIFTDNLGSFDKDALDDELTDMLMETSKIPDEFRFGQKARVAKITKKHLGERNERR